MSLADVSIRNEHGSNPLPSDALNSSQRQNKLDCALFYLEWTMSAYQAYTRTINELYLKRLVEHCMKSHIDESDTSERTEAERLARGPKIENKEDHHSMRVRLKDAIANMTGGDIDEEKRQKEKKISIGELAAMYRLKVLVQMSGSLLEIMETIKKSTVANIKLLKKRYSSIDVVPLIMDMFEYCASTAEIFHLISIDRDSIKPEYKSVIRVLDRGDYKSTKNEGLEIKEDAKDYIPDLEARINHYRTIVYMMGTKLLSIVQNYMKAVPQDQINLRAREVNEILDRLPPMYLKVNSIKLSSFTLLHLDNPPPNKNSFPLAPKEGSGKSGRSGKTSVVSKKKLSSSRKSERSSKKTLFQKLSKSGRSKSKASRKSSRRSPLKSNKSSKEKSSKKEVSNGKTKNSSKSQQKSKGSKKSDKSKDEKKKKKKK